MNRAQRTILASGALVILVLLGVGSWTFTATGSRTEETAAIPGPGDQVGPRGLTVRTWEETARCSILMGNRGGGSTTFESYVFVRLPLYDRYDAWREPVLAAAGATAILTVLAVLWCATPRGAGTDDPDTHTDTDLAIDTERHGRGDPEPGPGPADVGVSPSSAGPSPPR